MNRERQRHLKRLKCLDFGGHVWWVKDIRTMFKGVIAEHLKNKKIADCEEILLLVSEIGPESPSLKMVKADRIFLTRKEAIEATRWLIEKEIKSLQTVLGMLDF